ncbi:hypothetical protein [Antarcticimicrobium sediminis]|uniref:Uncharacterized protein n=1 Tax=Antarcticimicrobium sediminis TaxID=2546227 RepID=A0A4R5EJW6_9RHOB|nr:hypothetical protein [Antarcticimicrobium sediminis]TDE34925.1 hypothetical protein E1B25_18530 [Antarcticimicrobium sediminis]
MPNALFVRGFKHFLKCRIVGLGVRPLAFDEHIERSSLRQRQPVAVSRLYRYSTLPHTARGVPPERACM